MIARVRGQDGNTTLFTISFILICIAILLALFDLCRIYIAREAVKTVSDSIALAASQELLYFRPENIRELAKDMASNNGCRLIGLHAGYDEIEVNVERTIHVTVLEKIGLGSLNTVNSSSRVNVIYPWDRRLDNCRYYEFGFKPY